jgi:SAM-dependent methyltransferase
LSVYEPFAPVYDDWSAHMTEDVPFYVELARETEGPLVELAVGSGRVAVPVASETGRRVLGIDLSPAMLAQARDRRIDRHCDRDGQSGSRAVSGECTGRVACSRSSQRLRAELPGHRNRQRHAACFE